MTTYYMKEDSLGLSYMITSSRNYLDLIERSLLNSNRKQYTVGYYDLESVESIISQVIVVCNIEGRCGFYLQYCKTCNLFSLQALITLIY